MPSLAHALVSGLGPGGFCTVRPSKPPLSAVDTVREPWWCSDRNWWLSVSALPAERRRGGSGGTSLAAPAAEECTVERRTGPGAANAGASGTLNGDSRLRRRMAGAFGFMYDARYDAPPSVRSAAVWLPAGSQDDRRPDACRGSLKCDDCCSSIAVEAITILRIRESWHDVAMLVSQQCN